MNLGPTMRSGTLCVSATKLLLIITAVVMLNLAGCGPSTPATVNNDQQGPADPKGDSTAPVANPRDLPVQRAATLKIYSDPPGSLVYIDLAPVRNEKEGLALTPCEVEVPRGSYAVSVEKPGGKRATQKVDVQADRDLEFDVSSSPLELDDPSIMNAPLFEAAVGRSIPLRSLNTADKELDPYLTADGLTIYFASDRGGNRGVYTATRPSPYHEFPEAEIVQASSGADLPISPSVSNDGILMVYAVPEKSRLWQLSRSKGDGPFGNKEIARADEQGERAWRSAQLSGDGLRLYWTEEGDDSTITRAAVRPSAAQMFGKTLAFDLPGHHPHLSADGLRQFLFDGTTLKRSRRGTIKQSFGEPEVIAELQPDPYSLSPRHRQFWVTNDEQWLFYCDDPKSGGDLYVIRLSDGPGWGRTLVGKPIEDKMTVAKVETEEKPKPEAAPVDTVDARTQPLPYTTHWTKLAKLLEANKADEAVAAVRQAMDDTKLQGDRKLLAWDLELAEGLAEFNRDVQTALQALKPGETIRINGTRFEFVRYDDPTLHLKLKDKEITKKLTDLTPGDRVALADGPEKAEGAKALRFATYLYFQGKTNLTVAEGWLKRAGDDGEQFHERLAGRLLHQGTGELARGKVAEAIAFLDAVAAAGPGTTAARQASEKRETLYDALEWKAVGPRKWQTGPQGEFITDATRANGSYMMSERQYGDFELTCDWKVEGATALGGIFFRYKGQGKPLENGAKIHLANDPDLKRLDRFATGSLFAVTSPDLNASLPAGSWNTLRIQARGSAVQVWINSKQVLQTTLDKAIPDSGYIMLDGVAGGITYRKVLLYELTPTAK